MLFHADLHIHSKYSRATSKHCDLEHLAYWAAKKGIGVVGTGDFTHPVWRAELKEKLVSAEPGLFRLRDDLEHEVVRQLPPACNTLARFMLSVEISTIYKKGDLTRKIHHLIYVPDFDAADRFSESLARIGNIASDGRPILGLDSRDLLEIALESSPDAYLVPAHIWTPWFAMLGSRSGFDTVVDCYGDLSEHIFAVETGLSSDPAMNWRISFLDRYRLVSNSDAHSPAKLGREATLFDTDLDYYALRRALETGSGYVGTVEFFPEEGKYHLDGHRKCDTRLTPEETKAHDGRCPVCGQPVTVGVMHRVDALADRTEEAVAPPATAGGVTSLVPLPEIISEIVGTAPNSKKVAARYEHLVSTLGSELSILETVPLKDIERAESDLLSEGISRLRAGKVIRDAGYDGEYGVIRLFEQDELRQHRSGGLLFDLPATKSASDSDGATRASKPEALVPLDPTDIELQPSNPGATKRAGEIAASPTSSAILAALDVDQRAAAEVVSGPLLIVAGPGSGKTRTLTHRIAHLVADCGAPPAACLAITFTRRAATEMRERLLKLLPKSAAGVPVHTFHSFGLSILTEHANAAGLHRGFRVASEAERAAALAEAQDVSTAKAHTLLRAISKAKRTATNPTDELAEPLAAYRRTLALRNWVDFDDLVGLAIQVLESDPGLAAQYRDRYRWVSVDEFQDIDQQQYRLVQLLADDDANLCVIGDADQAIYGFRGADASCFARFQEDYPTAKVVRLARNYRSIGTIVSASRQVIGPASADNEAAEFVRDMHQRITIHAAPTERAEAEFVVHTMERLIGGHSFFSIDSGRTEDGQEADLSFSDIAVLYRTDAQSGALCEAFSRSGMPFQKHAHAPLVDHPGVPALMQQLGKSHKDGADQGSITQQLALATVRLAAGAGEDETTTIAAAYQHLKRLAATCGDDPKRFLEALPLATEADMWDPRADRVSLLTLHAAKGLEFRVVFIVGLEDGILPLRWHSGDNEPLDEERRLFYVGMTRAMDRLFLSRAERRLWRGKVREQTPSPFLRDIETELLKQSRSEVRPKKQGDLQLELL